MCAHLTVEVQLAIFSSFGVSIGGKVWNFVLSFKSAGVKITPLFASSENNNWTGIQKILNLKKQSC